MFFFPEANFPFRTEIKSTSSQHIVRILFDENMVGRQWRPVHYRASIAVYIIIAVIAVHLGVLV